MGYLKKDNKAYLLKLNTSDEFEDELDDDEIINFKALQEVGPTSEAIGSIGVIIFIGSFFLYEISSDKKMEIEDISYIEKEFNDILFEDDLVSFFNYLKLKQDKYQL